MLLCWLMLLSSPPGVRAETGLGSAMVPCPGKPRCVILTVDGTDQTLPPIFRAAISNTSINEIVLGGTRYVLRPSSWTVFTQQQPFRLTRNLTVRGMQVGTVLLLPACVSVSTPAMHHSCRCLASVASWHAAPAQFTASMQSAWVCSNDQSCCVLSCASCRVRLSWTSA